MDTSVLPLPQNEPQLLGIASISLGVGTGNTSRENYVGKNGAIVQGGRISFP